MPMCGFLPLPLRPGRPSPGGRRSPSPCTSKEPAPSPRSPTPTQCPESPAPEAGPAPTLAQRRARQLRPVLGEGVAEALPQAAQVGQAAVQVQHAAVRPLGADLEELLLVAAPADDEPADAVHPAAAHEHVHERRALKHRRGHAAGRACPGRQGARPPGPGAARGRGPPRVRRAPVSARDLRGAGVNPGPGSARSPSGAGIGPGSARSRGLPGLGSVRRRGPSEVCPESKRPGICPEPESVRVCPGSVPGWRPSEVYLGPGSVWAPSGDRVGRRPARVRVRPGPGSRRSGSADVGRASARSPGGRGYERRGRPSRGL